MLMLATVLVIALAFVFARAVRLIRSYFLPQAPRAIQVRPRGTHPSPAWQDMVMAVTSKYNGNLIAKMYQADQGATRYYALRSLEASMEAHEDGSFLIMDDATGYDVTELVMATVNAGMN